MKTNEYWFSLLSDAEKAEYKAIFDRNKNRYWNPFLMVKCDNFYSFIMSLDYGSDEEFDRWSDIAVRKIE